jgi:hypothetical protein
MKETIVRKLVLAVAAFALCSLPTLGEAQGLRAVRPLPGYACMGLRGVNPSWSFKQLPRILDKPSATEGKPVQLASAIVFAKSPLHIVNGFAEVLLQNGHPGWIQRAWLEPYRSMSDPHAKCTVSLMSNGQPGTS